MENGGYNLSPHQSDFATVDEVQLAYLSITPNHCQSSALHTTWPQVITFDLSSAVLTLSRRSALAPRSSSSFLLCIFLISIVGINVRFSTHTRVFPYFACHSIRKQRPLRSAFVAMNISIHYLTTFLSLFMFFLYNRSPFSSLQMTSPIHTYPTLFTTDYQSRRICKLFL